MKKSIIPLAELRNVGSRQFYPVYSAFCQKSLGLKFDWHPNLWF
jgi:hypothetical protein